MQLAMLELGPLLADQRQLLFRQICNTSPLPMDLSVSVCICVFVCYNREHRSYLSENPKNVKNNVCNFRQLPSNAVTAKIVQRDLAYFLNVQIENINIRTFRASSHRFGDIVDIYVTLTNV